MRQHGAGTIPACTTDKNARTAHDTGNREWVYDAVTELTRGRMATMPSRIAVIAIDAVQPRVVADFWCSVLGWEVIEEDSDGVSIAAPDRSWPTIDVLRVPEAKVVKNRLHLDLRAEGGSTAEELERLSSLGARPVDVGQPPEVSWVVLADPEGNEFCLLSRSVQEV